MLLFRPPQRNGRADSIPLPSADGTAACGNHPRNAATTSCNRCGIFVCGLCLIESDGLALCPACYDRLSEEGALASTRMRFRDSSGMAGTYAVAGLVMWFLCLIFGPLAIYHGVKAIRQRKLNPDVGSMWRAYLAIFLGLLEIAGGVALIVFVLRVVF